MIRVKNISKHYNLNAVFSLRDLFTAPFKSKKHNIHQALQNVSFDVENGTILGVIGKNGSGKSTLLKILSRITYPSSGSAIIKGSVSSLIEIGTGFHPELTGRENVYFNGALLGMKKQLIDDKFDEIVSFSGIGKYINVPVKQYSSGMYVRLAFAVAAHLESEILLIDEILSVGDYEFQMKCLGKIDEIKNQGRTIIFVSHDLFMVQKICDQCLWLDNGNIISIGDPEYVIENYIRSMHNKTFKPKTGQNIYVGKINLLNNTSFLKSKKQGGIIFEIVSDRDIQHFTLIIIIKNIYNQVMCVCNSLLEYGYISIIRGKNQIICSLVDTPFLSGEYQLDYYIKEFNQVLEHEEGAFKFMVMSTDLNEPKNKRGLIVKHKWISKTN